MSKKHAPAFFQSDANQVEEESAVEVRSAISPLL
jgi:hypothetical protein